MNAATNEVYAANICPGGDRAWMAARLWKLGRAPKIICTGPKCEASTHALLLDLGVPAGALVFLENPRNTEEESKAIGAKKVLLVTSAFHMRLAKLMFEKYAPEIEIVPAPTDFEATIGADEGFKFRELLPGVATMNEAYLREWIGYLGYKWLR